jgi:hypothetical protein
VPSGTPPGAPAGPPPPPQIQFPAEPYIPAPPPGNSVNGVPVPPVAPPAVDGALPVTPSANTGGQSPSVAVVPYDPNTGKYMTPDGRYEQQTNLIAGSAPKSWQELMPT